MITTEQAEQRRKYIGASDVPAIMGLSPFITPWEVWDAKVNGTVRPPGKAARIGTLLEDDVLTLADDYLDSPCTRSVCSLDLSGPKGVMMANFDGLGVYRGRPVVVEAKTTGITSEIEASWGDARFSYHPEHNPNVPMHVVYQVQAQLYCAGLAYGLALVACLRGGRGFALYKVPRDEAMIRHIVSYCHAWWQRHVVGGEPPEGECGKERAVCGLLRTSPRLRRRWLRRSGRSRVSSKTPTTRTSRAVMQA